jgi:hypothetical protein
MVNRAAFGTLVSSSIITLELGQKYTVRLILILEFEWIGNCKIKVKLLTSSLRRKGRKIRMSVEHSFCPKFLISSGVFREEEVNL